MLAGGGTDLEAAFKLLSVQQGVCTEVFVVACQGLELLVGLTLLRGWLRLVVDAHW